MMIQVNKPDAYQSINNNIKNQINEAFNSLPKSQPCKVEEVKGNKIKALRLLDNDNIVGFTDNVSIVRPIYFNYPIKKGDIGVLIAIDYPVTDYVKNSTAQPKKLNVSNYSYIFLPLAPDDIDFLQNAEALEMYSLDGKTSVIIDNDKIKIKDNASGEDDGDNNNILIDENGINILDTNKNNIILNSDGINIKDVNENNILLSSEGVKIEDKNGNICTLSNSGMNIEDKNGNVIEMGTASVKINNNLEVLQ